MGDRYADGFDKGYEDAADFVDQHPHGMPKSALQGARDEPPPEDDYERGRRDGWRERMKEEAWPTTIEESMG